MSRTITIAGKELPVKFTLRSLKVYEKLTGRNLIMENCMDIINLSLGVDATLAFVYCSLQVEAGKDPAITMAELELEMGIDYAVFSTVTDAYIDFVPGMSGIRKKILDNPELKAKLDLAGNDPDKIRQIFYEALTNLISQPEK